MQCRHMVVYINALRCLRYCASFLMSLVLVLGLLSQPGLAAEDEVVNSFDSVVDVQADGTLLVEESITVTALGERIRRGIYRDFPLRYAGAGGYGGDVPFKVISVTLDGTELDPNDVEYANGNIRIFMRGAEELPHGQHTFVLNYATSHHVRQFETADELNWNVTGADWALPIEWVSCLIRLPEGATISNSAGWLGPEGSRDSPLTVDASVPDERFFVGNLPVQPGEQFTVAVRFPKGVVVETPPEPRLLDKLFALNSQLWFKVMLIVLSFSYYVLAWFTWGRDPKPGAIVPLFHAPVVEGTGLPLSSVATPFILECRQLTRQGFASLFLSLALHGLCSIKKTAEGFTLQLHTQPTSPSQTATPLAAEERAAYRVLRAHANGRGELKLEAKANPVMGEVYKVVLDKLNEQYSAFWEPNAWIMYVGVAVLLPLCFTLGLGTPDDIWSMLTLGVLLGLGLLTLTTSVTALLRGFVQCKSLLIVMLFVLWMGFDSLDEVVDLLFRLFDSVLDPDNALLLAIFVPPVIFQRLMKAPSPACRALMDRLEGFQMYINTAEKNRIAAFNGPEETPAVFQEVLPYAVALGLTATWCSRFADQLAAGLIVSDNISLDDWNDRTFHNFVRTFSQSAASASSAERSSESAFSGGGGGGAGSGSGGGGGGGC